MVQMMNYGKLRPEPELPVMKASVAPAHVVKLEVEDQLDEERGPLNKRSKMVAAPLQQQWETVANMVPTQATHYNLLNEPSPLGLRLRKSPSLLDLIQMKLSQAHAEANSDTKDNNCFEDMKKEKDNKSTSSSATEKLKASNFPASILRIGTWEYVSKYEGDLVAKCYFAKHKLVWEVLEGGLKSKMEIQWSDITSLKATCPENEPGTLDIVLARQPLFFRETNPQPRKHTLWQATSDFTDGQASLHRRHFLQCPPGLLNKHFEKLIQCDPRLYSLSQQPDIMSDKPFFEPRCSVFEEQDESKCQIFSNLNGSAVEGFCESSMPCTSTSNSTDVTRTPVVTSQEVHSPSSVVDARVRENSVGESKRFKRSQQWDQVRVPGLQPSMSMRDFVNQIGHCISEQMNSTSAFPGEALPNKDVLEELTQYLFSDAQNPASDEQGLMSRVNSFCNLLQKDGISVSGLHNSAIGDAGSNDGIDSGMQDQKSGRAEDKNAFGSKQATSIPRKDSFGDLLMHLPRIASLPQFLPLFKIAEDNENYENSSPSS